MDEKNDDGEQFADTPETELRRSEQNEQPEQALPTQKVAQRVADVEDPNTDKVVYLNVPIEPTNKPAPKVSFEIVDSAQQQERELYELHKTKLHTLVSQIPNIETQLKELGKAKDTARNTANKAKRRGEQGAGSKSNAEEKQREFEVISKQYADLENTLKSAQIQKALCAESVEQYERKNPI